MTVALLPASSSGLTRGSPAKSNATHVMTRQPAVYIVTNKPRGTLYVGMTGSLGHRLWQHRTHAVPGFTDRYNLGRLVWFEMHFDFGEAIRREKALKRWNRSWKIALVEESNPGWRDLWEDVSEDLWPRRSSGQAGR